MSPHYVFWRFLFWPQLAGAVFLLFGFIALRKELSLRPQSLPNFGRVFVAFALAVFGGEHLASAGFMKDMVPSYVPAHMFWIYFVGFCLFAAAISIILDRYVVISASLLGLMFVLFVLMLHLPRALELRNDRFAWAVAVRECFFATGVWTLAATRVAAHRPVLARRVITACRVFAAFVLLFYGVEHLLHPEYTPGVPLPQLSPAWLPWKHVWGFSIGMLELASGVAMLINKKSRAVTTWLGVGVTLVVLFINFPMFVLAKEGSDITTGINYVADTLLFAGIIFLLADAMPTEPQRVPNLVPALERVGNH